jgi:hypothetical protein
MATFVINAKQTQLLESVIVALSVMNTIYAKNATKMNVINTEKFSNNMKTIKISVKMKKHQN